MPPLNPALSLAEDPAALSVEGQRPDPVDFTPEELRELQRRFGVHGPQTRLAQLFTEGLDQLQPLRSRTLSRLEAMRPLILQQARRQSVNPMLLTAILFDEMQHGKPGENLPFLAHSGLFRTLGPAQLGVGELQHQGLLSDSPSDAELAAARERLLDPASTVELLAAKMARLKRALDLPADRMLQSSVSPRDAKGLATLAYLHNGKLDYPARILSYMHDAELHALIYSRRQPIRPPLV
ncbi:helicase DnaB [Synechococcus sp. RSCCF101]|uniref:helicase DnaB n=1 Tax=Synechococcus sp. RSCCF101 TaxID=2511069 RepID=UPI00351A37C6